MAVLSDEQKEAGTRWCAVPFAMLGTMFLLEMSTGLFEMMFRMGDQVQIFGRNYYSSDFLDSIWHGVAALVGALVAPRSRFAFSLLLTGLHLVYAQGPEKYACVGPHPINWVILASLVIVNIAMLVGEQRGSASR